MRWYRRRGYHHKRSSFLEDNPYSTQIKGMLVMAIIGVGYTSYKLQKLAIDVWLSGYFRYFKTIFDYYDSGASMFFDITFIFNYLLSELVYTLFTFFILWFIIDLIRS